MCSKHNLLFIFFFSLESFPETFTGYLVETRDVRQECDPVGSCKKKKKKAHVSGRGQIRSLPDKKSHNQKQSDMKLAGQTRIMNIQCCAMDLHCAFIQP